MTKKIFLALTILLLVCQVYSFVMQPKETPDQSIETPAEEHSLFNSKQKSEDYRKYSYIITTYL